MGPDIGRYAIHLCTLLLCLLLGLFAGGLLGGVILLLVHDQACPAFVLVPLEASEEGFFQFVIRLGPGVRENLDDDAWRVRDDAYLLLVLLVDGIERVLDGDALQIPGGDLQAQGEVQVNLLDRRLDEVEFQDVLVLNGGR